MVGAGPQVPLGVGADELHGDPDAILSPKDRALEERIDPQLAGDHRHRSIGPLVLDGRLPRDHRQLRDLTQLGHQGLVQAVHEVLLPFIPGKVCQRQHGQPADLRGLGPELVPDRPTRDHECGQRRHQDPDPLPGGPGSPQPGGRDPSAFRRSAAAAPSGGPVEDPASRMPALEFPFSAAGESPL